jgi:hypothetical protein
MSSRAVMVEPCLGLTGPANFKGDFGAERVTLGRVRDPKLCGALRNLRGGVERRLMAVSWLLWSAAVSATLLAALPWPPAPQLEEISRVVVQEGLERTRWPVVCPLTDETRDLPRRYDEIFLPTEIGELTGASEDGQCGHAVSTRYAYHDLYAAQFEELVVAICSVLLGDGVQPFSSGPDGGRDARFDGTALCLPSSAAPHAGRFIAQAKHTEHPFAKYSDPDFASDADSSVLSKEIPRIERLVDDGELDHYLLFSNRRLAGNTESVVRERLQNETGAKTVEVFGIERIELLLKRHPEIVRIANIAEVNMPLRVSPDDLAEVVVALADNKDAFGKIQPTEIERVAFEQKNEVNNLPDRFAALIKKDYLLHFDAVRKFLAAPTNEHILQRYLEAVAEFNEKIVAHRSDWDDFGRALVYLQDILFGRDGDLKRNKRTTKLIIYYMYWNCDLGDDGSSDAQA